ncbi:MAG: hypothetical protein EBT97_08335 [Actinobacteria bacterium]|nr:hypothetical protein [Actinomycetota bacterium]
MQYDPHSPASRRALAEGILNALTNHSFMEEYDERSGERVLYRPHPKGVRVQVWTSVDRSSGLTRDVGDDAIRVCAVYRAKDGTDRGILKTTRVNRVGEVDAIVGRVVARARTVWGDANSAPRCNRCGAPTFTSKAGNQVCAELCWK